ncbi:restriction endonuclease subunit S, partial [Acidobacteriota bacterium]
MTSSLPKSWSWATFQDVASPDKNAIVDGPFGSNLKVADYIDDQDGIPVLSTKNLKQGFRNDLVRFISREKFEELKRSEVKGGDILVAKIGSVGKSAIYPEGHNSAMIPANLLKMTVNPLMDRKFTFYFINSLFFFKELSLITTATAQPAFNVTKFRKLKIPIPPLPEQHRIVAKLEELFTKLDAGVDALKQVRAQLKRYRQSVLKAAVEGRLTVEWREEHKDELEFGDELLERILKERRVKWEARQLARYEAQDKSPPKNWRDKYKEPRPPETSELPKLPRRWGWATAEQLTNLITDGEHVTPLRTKRGILLLSARNIQNGHLSFQKVDYVSKETYKKLTKRLKIKYGDVLMSCSGSVGRSCVAPEDQPFCLVRSVAVLRPVDKMGDFLSYCIQSPFLQKQIDEKKTQTAQANIFQGKIRQLVFPVAPSLEQIKIVKSIDRLFSIIDESEQIIEFELKHAQS